MDEGSKVTTKCKKFLETHFSSPEICKRMCFKPSINAQTSFSGDAPCFFSEVINFLALTCFDRNASKHNEKEIRVYFFKSVEHT